MVEGSRNYNLFPPIVDSYMPSFDIEDGQCQILFQISDYNSQEEIDKAEVSVRYQSNNTSALVNGLEYKEVDLNENSIIITNEMLAKPFEANIIYKIQIRFLDANKKYSEWSTVCLIKGINAPVVRVPLFDDAGDLGDMVINTGTLEVNAIVDSKVESKPFEESIYYYEMYIYKNGAVYEHSGKIYTTDENERNLKYTFKKQLEVNQAYELEIIFCTTSNYIQSEKYDFVHTIIDEQMDITIHVQENDEQGYIEAAVSTKDLIPGSYILLRASSLDNFTTWRDIHLFQKGIDEVELVQWIKNEHNDSLMDGKPYNKFQDSYIEDDESLKPEKQELYIYKDYTVQSGVMYKYKIQNYGKGGIRSLDSTESDAILCYFDHLFLSDKDFQLKIKFDSNVASPKKNIMEAKTDTIGGKYPVIRRNGNMNYESFSISGIISAFGDENEFYDDSWKQSDEWKKNYYDKYSVSNMRDFIGEKTYRDKVSEFLHNGQIKLFRSTQEGNFLVRLMDISFTPNQQLGRLIYSFQATAYQIADLTIDNYFKYNIIEPIVYDEGQNIISNETVFGQIQGTDVNVVKNMYNRQYFFNNYGYETVFNKFNKVKITAITPWPTETDKDIRLNAEQSIILNGNNIGLTIPVDSIIEYEADIKITYIQDAYKTQYISYNIGQLAAAADKDIISVISAQYNQDIKDKYYQEVEKINAIHFINLNSLADCKVVITYADLDKENKPITTEITIKANDSYVLKSDKLETKEIVAIVPSQPINVDYYYELSKKYYFK